MRIYKKSPHLKWPIDEKVKFNWNQPKGFLLKHFVFGIAKKTDSGKCFVFNNASFFRLLKALKNKSTSV